MLHTVFLVTLFALANGSVRSAAAVVSSALTIDTVTATRLVRDEQAQHADLFDRADRRSRAAIEQIRCSQRVAALRREGAFGSIDSLGRRGHCALVDDRYVGIFFDSDTLFTTVSRFSAVYLASSTRFTAPIDTSAILAVARASRTAQLRGREEYERAQRQYTPVAWRSDRDSIEVWLLPAAALFPPPFMVGGERGYVFSPDGRTLVREIDAFNAFRSIPVPDTGVVRITSAERVAPTMTELLLANLLHGSGRSIVIEMPSRRTTLVGKGGGAVWMHVDR